MDRREARVECVKVLLGMGYEWLARDKDGTALCYDKTRSTTHIDWS